MDRQIILQVIPEDRRNHEKVTLYSAYPEQGVIVEHDGNESASISYPLVTLDDIFDSIYCEVVWKYPDYDVLKRVIADSCAVAGVEILID